MTGENYRQVLEDDFLMGTSLTIAGSITNNKTELHPISPTVRATFSMILFVTGGLADVVSKNGPSPKEFDSS